MWRKAYKIEWTVEAGFLCIRAEWQDSHFVLLPFGPADDAALSAVLDKLMNHFAEQDWPFVLHGMERFMVELVERIKPGLFEFTADRDDFDYVYQAADLLELKGRKFHGKKNHANAFRKAYPEHRYVPLTKEITDSCIQLAIDWCEKNCEDGHDESLECEKKAIIEALECMDELKLVGGAILLDGKVEAFTYGEQINDNTAVVHIEKANTAIRGLYPVINQEFCRHYWSQLTYINREEDMGLEGLRKAKESYHPVSMVEKFVGKIRCLS